MISPASLPADWIAVTLRDLHIGNIGSIDPRCFPDEQFEYYSIPAYQESAGPLIAQGREIQSQKLSIPPSCLLFGKLNPRVEKVWNVKSTSLLRRIASTEWLPIVVPERLDRDFGYYLLRSDWVMPIAKGLVSGSTPSRERIEPKAFYDITVPLPPLDEQKKIASLLSILDQTILKQKGVIDELADLKRAAMRELFTRGLRGGLQKDTELGPLPDSWAVVPLGSLGRIGNGSTPKRSVSDYWANGEVPWLNSGTLYDREIKSSGQYISGVALKECHLPIVKPGAVLIAITGQGKTLGHCAVLHIEATVSQHVAYVQVDSSLAESGYVRGYLETQYDALRQVAAGGGSTKGALTCGYLRGVLLPLPHLDEQRQIVAILDAIDSKTAMHRRKAAILDELFGVLLHELVTGQIRVRDLEAATIAGGSLAETAS